MPTVRAPGLLSETSRSADASRPSARLPCTRSAARRTSDVAAVPSATPIPRITGARTGGARQTSRSLRIPPIASASPTKKSQSAVASGHCVGPDAVAAGRAPLAPTENGIEPSVGWPSSESSVQVRRKMPCNPPGSGCAIVEPRATGGGNATSVPSVFRSVTRALPGTKSSLNRSTTRGGEDASRAPAGGSEPTR